MSESAAVPALSSWLPVPYVFDRLVERLDGLTDEEYSWPPAADGSVTTIAWRLVHIADTLREERNWRWTGRVPIVRDADAERPTTAAGGIAYLSSSYALWRQLVDSLEPDEMWQPMGAVAGPFEGEPIAALVAHILDELTHHAAEVALLRDLYAAQSRS